MTTPPPNPEAPGKKPLSEAQLRQRREAAQHSTGPKTEEGKARVSRNGWKHGLTSAVHKLHFDNGLNSLLGVVGKPCLSTCPKYPCPLVQDEITRPGGSCLDKQVYVQAFASIIDAIEGGSMDGMHGLMASEMASTVQMLHDLRATIADQGLVIGIPMIDSEGNVVTRQDGSEVMGKYLPNPGVALIAKLQEILGISLPEALVTPKSQAQAKTDKETTDAVQTLMGGIFQRAAAARRDLPPPRPAIEHDGGE